MFLFRPDKVTFGCHGNIRVSPALPVQFDLFLSLCISAKQQIVFIHLVKNGTFFMDTDQKFIYIMGISRINGQASV